MANFLRALRVLNIIAALILCSFLLYDGLTFFDRLLVIVLSAFSFLSVLISFA